MCAVFDNFEHATHYIETMASLFGVSGSISKKGNKNCYEAGFGSIVVHWFFRSYLEFHTGYKAHKIEIPKRILEAEDFTLINACLRGLFDSDGTIIPINKEVKLASVSQKIIDQTAQLLQEQGMKVYRGNWLKDSKYRILYDVRTHGIQTLLIYSRLIGFDHPLKQKKLYNLLGQQFVITKPSPVE